MSKVAIQGNASGTGTFTIAAPNSNTDRTLTLPDEAGTVLTSGTALSSFPSGFANGITHMTQYKLDATLSTVNDDVVTNWELPDRNYNGIGTAVSVSSGLFSFPVTGTWLATSSYTCYSNSGGVLYMGFKHEFSTDSGSSFTTLAGDVLNSAYTSSAYQTAGMSMILHVSDISTYRFRVIVQTSDSQGRIVVIIYYPSSISRYRYCFVLPSICGVYCV